MISLQNELERATGGTIDIEEKLKQFEGAADRNSRNTMEMAAAYRELRNTTQNMDFAEKTFELAAVGANATGESVKDVGAILSQLNERFGVTAEEAPAALQKVIEFADRGAFSLEEFSSIADGIVPTFKLAGLEGTKGLDILLGTFEDVDNQLGTTGQKVTGVQNLLLDLAKPAKIKAIAKGMAVNPKDMLNEGDTLERLRMIVSKGGKGLESLRAQMVGPEQVKALELLLKPFREAQDVAKKAGDSPSKAIEKGLNAFDEQISGFGKATGDITKLKEQAARAMDSPERKLKLALEKVQQSFQNPKFIGAIEKLADKLPQMADGVAKMVEFIVDNPLMAGGIALGGKAASSFAGPSIAKMMLGGGAKAGTEAGEALVKSGAKTGAATAGGFAKGVKGPLGMSGGKIFGAAAAGVIAFEMTSALLDHFDEVEERDKKLKGSGEVKLAGEKALKGGTVEHKAMAAEKLKRAADQADKAAETGPVQGAIDYLSELGQLATGGAGSVGRSDSEVLSGQASDMRALAAALEEQIANAKSPDRNSGKITQLEDLRSVGGGQGGKVSKVKIDNMDNLSSQLSKGLASQVLRVQVTNLPAPGGGGNNSRGPGAPPPPSAGGGTGSS